MYGRKNSSLKRLCFIDVGFTLDIEQEKKKMCSVDLSLSLFGFPKRVVGGVCKMAWEWLRVVAVVAVELLLSL